MANMIYRSHPWHGLSLGPLMPQIVNCYIEIVPTDTIKYELDKETGILKVDRPQKYSSVCPSLYGLLPKTYCGPHLASYCMQKTGLKSIEGDGDPLDICVFTEKVIPRGDIILKAIPIGGFRLIDGNEADDKIIAVMADDLVYGSLQNIHECSPSLIERLRHYFLTYKDSPERTYSTVQITHIYDVKEAHHVIKLALQDYEDKYGSASKSENFW
ncbi:Inorganic pyrophosphatase|uniref:inorganic pyrophosphatase n=1 Tax=Neochlamydia sp. AcF84 TaxID=2315858 RepID=UPI00140DC6AF|nr:inorganic pyrophosphatase [Neochlamydia sp. AcF84]NGY95296.1 Inorganic pyrophosphatase [Neochlamydia sp. AcF84]